MKMKNLIVLCVAAVLLILFATALSTTKIASADSDLICSYSEPAPQTGGITDSKNYLSCSSTARQEAPKLDGSYTYTFTMKASDRPAVWMHNARQFVK